MKIIFFISLLLFIVALMFLPLIGAWIGLQSVINGSNDKWQDENKDAYLIYNGR